MVIEKRIKIKDVNYLLGIEVKYDKSGILVKKDNTYFDVGDFNKVISWVESNYDSDCIYDKKVYYMNDIIYLYDRFPFIDYIKDITYDSNNQITQIGTINKEEIIDYIKANNIRIGMFDGKKSICHILYKVIGKLIYE